MLLRKVRREIARAEKSQMQRMLQSLAKGVLARLTNKIILKAI